ncbi:MAG: hypothetical protein O7C75_16700 [Verrucomicrobia bacterium]|nr:hypothetical protein [Verrucomicrobiota bacterium]
MKHREFNWAPPPVRLAYSNTGKVVCLGVEKLPRIESDKHAANATTVPLKRPSSPQAE